MIDRMEKNVYGFNLASLKLEIAIKCHNEEALEMVNKILKYSYDVFCSQIDKNQAECEKHLSEFKEWFYNLPTEKVDLIQSVVNQHPCFNELLIGLLTVADIPALLNEGFKNDKELNSANPKITFYSQAKYRRTE